jgi:hypothetical protein
MAVLISAASHAEAYRLERILQLPAVIFADYQELPKFPIPGRKYLKIPAGNSASYAHVMLDLALNAGIEKIFPLYAEEILPLAESRQLFAEYGISLIVPSVPWLKRQSNIHFAGPAEWVVIELGQVIAGTTPVNFSGVEKDVSGIFQFEVNNPALKLLTV